MSDNDTLIIKLVTDLSQTIGGLQTSLALLTKQNEARDVAVTMHWLRRCAQVRQITLLCTANVGKIKLEDTWTNEFAQRAKKHA